MRGSWFVLTVIVFLALLVAPRIAAAEIVESSVDVIVEVTTPDASRLRHLVKVAIFRDDKVKAAPFLLLSHGRAPNADGRRAISVQRYAANARYLVTLGYAVFLPLRIGYGATGGPDLENSGACDNRAYDQAYRVGVEQSLAVIEYAKTQPYVDAAHGIAVGQSFGGTIAVALAGHSVPGLRAAVNFAGGGGGRPKTHPGQPCRPDLMEKLFATYGATSRIPTLWVYSSNDQYWGPDLPRTWMSAFTAAGGSATFVELPPYRNDGHPAFTGAPGSWRGPLESFLARCCARDRRH